MAAIRTSFVILLAFLAGCEPVSDGSQVYSGADAMFQATVTPAATETYRLVATNADGSITVPVVLRPYMGGMATVCSR